MPAAVRHKTVCRCGIDATGSPYPLSQLLLYPRLERISPRFNKCVEVIPPESIHPGGGNEMRRQRSGHLPPVPSVLLKHLRKEPGGRVVSLHDIGRPGDQGPIEDQVDVVRLSESRLREDVIIMAVVQIGHLTGHEVSGPLKNDKAHEPAVQG